MKVELEALKVLAPVPPQVSAFGRSMRVALYEDFRLLWKLSAQLPRPKNISNCECQVPFSVTSSTSFPTWLKKAVCRLGMRPHMEIVFDVRSVRGWSHWRPQHGATGYGVSAELDSVKDGTKLTTEKLWGARSIAPADVNVGYRAISLDNPMSAFSLKQP